MRNFAQILGCCLWLAAAVSAVGADESPLYLTPQKGVLLLKNGHVLQGNVTQAGEYYYLSLDSGEIRVRTGDVECFCRSLDAGYEHKRQAVPENDLHQRLDLAEWCLQHGLINAAARELTEAYRIHAEHPRFEFVERRLQLALNPPADQASSEATNAIRLTNERLDALVRSMPTGATDTFTSTIQPMLVNRCSNAGCHGPGSTTGYSLLRLPASKNLTRRLTQRNLMATLDWVDRQNPTASPLLLKAIEPHGASKTPAFTTREMAQYQQLVAWVFRVSEPQKVVRPESVNARPTTLLQTAPLAPPRQAADEALGEPARLDHDATAQAVEVIQASAAMPIGSGKQPQRGAVLPSYTPVDEFDPEIFNRRFFPPSEPVPAGNR